LRAQARCTSTRGKNFGVLILTKKFALAIELVDKEAGVYRRIGILNLQIPDVKPPEGRTFTELDKSGEPTDEIKGNFMDFARKTILYLL
jgi:hypothetical protein